MKINFKQDKSVLYNYEIDEIADITGICLRSIYISPTNDYGIYLFEDENEIEFSVLSNTTALIIGQTYFLHGKITYNDKFKKRDFRLYDFIPFKPNTKNGIITFIENIPGLKSKADLIYDTFGETAIDIILNTPEELKQLNGIGDITVIKVKNAATQFNTNYKTIISLMDLGMTNNQVIKVLKEIPENTLIKINQNPYQLINIKGFTYEFADNIARKLNFNGDSPFRINATALHILHTASFSGNTYLDIKDFLTKIKQLLLIKYSYLKINETTTSVSFFGILHFLTEEEKEYALKNSKDIIIKEFTDEEILENLGNKILIDKDKIYLKELYYCEKIFAEKVMKLSQNKKQIYDEIDVKRVLKNICKKENITLEKNQEKAVIQICMYDSGVFLLCGSAGTGKTFITKIIVKVKKKLHTLYQERYKLKFLGLAPTVKASKVMANNFDDLKIKCKTIHLGLESQYEHFNRNENNKLDENYFIVDESSMLNIQLAKALMIAIPKKSTVIFLGDTKQLLPIGPGNVLNDMIESNCLPLITLSVVKRQTALSGILKNAEHVINMEKLEETPNTDDFYLFNAMDVENIQKLILEQLHNLFDKGFNLFDIQLLIPQRQGQVGIYMINYLIQQELNKEEKKRIPLYKFTLLKQSYQLYISKNDKVMQTRNDYSKIMLIEKNGKLVEDHEGITNGEIGIVEDIYVNNNGEKIVLVRFDEYYAEYRTLDDLELAYAITIHKSQGSQWPATIILISNNHKYMLENNLLYTAITRSIDYCSVIYDEKGLNHALITKKNEQRNTNLIENLKKYA